MTASTYAIAHSVIALLFCAFLLGVMKPTSELQLALAVTAAFLWPVSFPVLAIACAWAILTTPRGSW